MPINRLSFPEGTPLPVDQRQDAAGYVAHLLEQHIGDLVTLEPGEYNLTPSTWTRNTHVHTVTVLDNGEAVYRLLPKYRDAGTVRSEGSRASNFRPGGTSSPINEDSPVAVVMGQNEQHANRLDIYEVVVWTSRRLTPAQNNNQNVARGTQEPRWRKWSQHIGKWLFGDFYDTAE